MLSVLYVMAFIGSGLSQVDADRRRRIEAENARALVPRLFRGT